MEKTMNKVELNGFVGITPEVFTLKNGSRKAELSLATNESYKNSSDEWVKITTWHKVIMWNKTADAAVEQIKKGSRIAIEGKIVNRQFTDKQGNNRQITEILAVSFQPVINEAVAA